MHAVIALQAVLVFIQASLAGQHLSGRWHALAWHATNARVIEAVGVAQLLLAVVVWRRRGPVWPAALSVLLWLAVELQRWLGQTGQLGAHVPLGVAIFGLTVALFIGSRRLAGKPPPSEQRLTDQRLSSPPDPAHGVDEIPWSRRRGC